MNRDHANHNEDACDYLLESGKFNEWVVTTAFYSSLHHVHFEVFPLNIDGINIKSFHDYCEYRREKTGREESKHKLTVKLAKEYMRGSYGSYKWLYDQCMTARYNNYSVSEAIAYEAKKKLQLLKSYLKKK